MSAAPQTPLDDALTARVHAWVENDLDDDDRASLTYLLVRAQTDAEARRDLEDRFAADLQFGTAGLRGAMAAGPNRMNRAVVVRAASGLGRFLGDALADAGAGSRARVVIGYDARHRSRTFATDSAAVLTAAGHEVGLLPSALPTPVLAYAVRALGADAGIMVTASHNPRDDNGYKVYLGGRVVTDSGQGAQIVPPYDALIAERIAAAPPAVDVPRAADGWTVLGPEVLRGYLDSVGRLASASAGGQAKNLRIVTTAMHGVGGQVLSTVLDEAGFGSVAVVGAQADPDPDFPTVSFPNPEEPGAMDLALALAADWGADVVLANDPDADRCAVAIPVTGADGTTWRRLHGDEVGSLLGEQVARRAPATAPGDAPATLASSVVSSRLLAKIAAAHDLEHRTTLTGFKWISRVPGLVFGYEEALGYCVDPGHVRDKDGISAALEIAELAQALKAQDRTVTDALDDLARAHGLHLTDQVSARFTDLAEIGATMRRLEQSPPQSLAGSPVVESFDLESGYLGLPPTVGTGLTTADGTRVIVRPSGTEPKVKAYLEVIEPVAPDAGDAAVAAARAAARRRLDAVAADVRAALGL